MFHRAGLKGATGSPNPGDVSTALSERSERRKRATSRGSLVSEANETSKDERSESFGGRTGRGFPLLLVQAVP